MTKGVFSGGEIGSIRLSNRMIRSATHEGLADERGQPTEALIKKYEQLARGGVGAIITGYAGVNQAGKSPLKNMLMIDRDDLISSYRNLVERIHQTGVPIFLQIAHCGRQTRSKITGRKPVAPSSLRDRIYFEDKPRELSEPEIQQLVDDFILAIGRAVQSGFDGVQLHMAHGYLLAQFLSSYTNRRKDRWGGSLENRFRIVREIFERARKLYPDYPILVKLNSKDNRKGGMRIEDSIQIARWLEESGCDGIEVSCGSFEDGFMVTRGPEIPVDAMLRHHFAFQRIPQFIRGFFRFLVPFIVPSTPEPFENYNIQDAAMIRSGISLPVITVGGIRRLDDMEKFIREEKTDFIAMSRPLIREPSLVQKFRDGRSVEASCTSCNYCSILQETNPLRCYNGRLKE